MSLVVVTGGGGFVGLRLVEALLARGHRVRSLQRGRYERLETLSRRGQLEVHRGDLVDAEFVSRALEGVEGVFHVAAKAGVWGPYVDYYRSNVVATQNVLAGCRAQGVRKLVYTSTPSVVHSGHSVAGVDENAPYAERFETAYPETKAIAERMVLADNSASLATLALRPHLVWGPGDPHLVARIVERARAGRLVLVGDGSNVVDATFVDSAVHAHLCAWDRLEAGASCAGRPYFIAQGEPMPLRELIDGILLAAALPRVSRTVPPKIAYGVGALLEAVYGAVGARREPPLTRFVAQQLATSHYYDLHAAKRDLGYEAPISTAQGLALLAESFRQGAS